MAVTKILDIDGVKTLWEKIKGTFIAKGAVNAEIESLKSNEILIGNAQRGDGRLFIGTNYTIDFDDFKPVYNNYVSQITIDNHKTLSGNEKISILSDRQIGIKSSSVKSYATEQNFMRAGTSINVSLQDMYVDGGLRFQNGGLNMTKDKTTITTADVGLFFNNNTASKKSCLVTKTGFAMGMTTNDIGGDTDMGNPGGSSGSCAFYFDKSKTLIGCSDTAATRNVVEIQKGTVRMRANGTSLLKASTDTSYTRLASKTGCVAAYQNLYVVNPDNNVAGLKVETDTNGNVITTIGDKTQNIEDVLRIEYAGHTYSLDLVRLEDDGYLTQID